MRFLIPVLLLFSVAASGQSYDSVAFRSIRINGFQFGSKKAELEKKFGPPTKVVTTEEKGADQYSDYHYNRSTLRVSPAGVFNGFKLTDDGFALEWGQHSISVGSSLKEFGLYFPHSMQAYAKDPTKKFKLKIRPGITYIILKTKEGVVTAIETKDQPD